MTRISQDALDKALLKAAGQGRAEMVTMLLRQGADANAGAGEAPAIFIAAAGNHAECIRRLLNAGADINARNSKGSTALMVAAFNANMKALAVLLDAGADRSLRNKEGTDALSFAKTRGAADAINMLSQDPDEVIHQSRLGDRVLEEIFNFRTLERISLVRKAPGQPVEALYRESFTHIENLPALRKAFEQHRTRGGTRREQDVFPQALAKPAKLRRPPQ